MRNSKVMDGDQSSPNRLLIEGYLGSRRRRREEKQAEK